MISGSLLDPARRRLGMAKYEWWNEGLHGVANSPGVSFGGEVPNSTMFPQAKSPFYARARALACCPRHSGAFAPFASAGCSALFCEIRAPWAAISHHPSHLPSR